MSYKVDFKSKLWLNPDTTAFIFTEVFRDYDKTYATLKLGDCSRIVDFDAYIHTEKAKEDLVAKVNIIIDELTKFKGILGELNYDN